MLPLTEAAIRSSFVNCTKGEAGRLAVPRDLADQPWADLDFFGWRDGAAPQRAYLVAEYWATPTSWTTSTSWATSTPTPAATPQPAPSLTGVALRVAPQAGQGRRSMCALCLTTHTGDGVSLISARKAGPAGRQGNTVGSYICSDLACSLYLRGRKGAGQYLEETLTVEEKIERTRANLDAFLLRVID